jgi:glycosyltransferase 2 family protein
VFYALVWESVSYYFGLYLYYNIHMRKFIMALILLLGIYLIITRFTEAEGLYLTLQRGDWRYLALALLLASAQVYMIGLIFKSVYYVVDLKESSRHMMLVTAAANFVNIATPTGGVGFLATFIADGKARGHSSARVMVAWALYVLFDYVSLMFYLTLGLAVLARRNNLTWTEGIASIFLLVGALGFGTVLYLGMRSENMLARALAWLARLVNRIVRPFIKRPLVEEARAYTFAHDAAEGIDALRHDRRRLLRPLLLALANKTLLILIFLLMFLAFKVPFSAGTIFAGFSLGHLFVIVSPTAQGIGIMEGMLTLALTSLWVKVEAAAIITLVYRAYTFWLPFFFGMYAFRRIGAQKPRPPEPAA